MRWHPLPKGRGLRDRASARGAEKTGAGRAEAWRESASGTAPGGPGGSGPGPGSGLLRRGCSCSTDTRTPPVGATSSNHALCSCCGLSCRRALPPSRSLESHGMVTPQRHLTLALSADLADRGVKNSRAETAGDSGLARILFCLSSLSPARGSFPSYPGRNGLSPHGNLCGRSHAARTRVAHHAAGGQASEARAGGRGPQQSTRATHCALQGLPPRPNRFRYDAKWTSRVNGYNKGQRGVRCRIRGQSSRQCRTNAAVDSDRVCHRSVQALWGISEASVAPHPDSLRAPRSPFRHAATQGHGASPRPVSPRRASLRVDAATRRSGKARAPRSVWVPEAQDSRSWGQGRGRLPGPRWSRRLQRQLG